MRSVIVWYKCMYMRIVCMYVCVYVYIYIRHMCPCVSTNVRRRFRTLVIVSCKRITTARSCSKGSAHTRVRARRRLDVLDLAPVAYFCLGSSSRPESRRSAAWRASSARFSAISCSSACVSSRPLFASGSSASPRRIKPTNSSTLTPPEQSSSSRRQRPWILTSQFVRL